MIGVVVSREDEASLTIRDALLGAAVWEERVPEGDWEREWRHDDGGGFVMVEKDGLHLYYDGIDADLKEAHPVDLVVFVSRHSGDTGPLLTAHHTGNFGDAEYGGEPRSLAVPAPAATKHLLCEFDENAPEGFNVSMEATHHGPSELGTPSVFAEVGSGPSEWEREDAAQAVAHGVLSLGGRDEPRTSVVGVGGGHYAPRFTRVALETDAAVGHIAADYALPIKDELLTEAYELSGADAVLLDGEATEESFDVPVVSEDELRERAGVPEQTIDSVKEVLGVSLGRAHLTRRAEEGGENAVAFDAGLVRESRNVDSEETEEILEEYAFGYEEKEGQVEEVAVPRDGVRSLAEELADVLHSKYDVSLDGDGVILEREVFDAEAARELGVKEGPEFGRLSAGETVEVGGKTVRPKDVHETERRFFGLEPSG